MCSNSKFGQAFHFRFEIETLEDSCNIREEGINMGSAAEPKYFRKVDPSHRFEEHLISMYAREVLYIL